MTMPRSGAPRRAHALGIIQDAAIALGLTALALLDRNSAWSSSEVPVDVSGLTDAVAVSVGYVHACALSRTGSVRCWGANVGLGSGSSTDRDSPRPVTVTGF